MILTMWSVPSTKFLSLTNLQVVPWKGRRFSDGLHQAIEAKEGVPVQEETKTSASITYQNMFRMYKKLSGMTGTGKLRKMNSVKFTTCESFRFQLTVQFNVLTTMTFFTLPDAKFRAVVQDVKRRYEKDSQSLLVRVPLETSDLISKMLVEAGIPHEVLNAKNHEKEAPTIMECGSTWCRYDCDQHGRSWYRHQTW